MIPWVNAMRVTAMPIFGQTFEVSRTDIFPYFGGIVKMHAQDFHAWDFRAGLTFVLGFQCGALWDTHHRKNIVITTYRGRRIKQLYAMYPKKLGILTLDCSAIALTIKFGPLAMYVIPPINTVPSAIAIK